MVTYNDLQIITDILNKLSWYEKLRPEHQNEVYENFYSLICETNSEIERTTVYSLLRKLLNFHLETLYIAAEELLYSIPNDYIASANDVFFIPVASRNDKGRQKSGATIVNCIKSIIPQDKRFSSKNNFFLAEVDALSQHAERTNSLIVFCDDFIGAGRQYLKCLEWYSDFELSSDRTILITAHIHSFGLEKLSNHEVLFKEVHKRGISDDPLINSQECIEAIKDMGRRIGVKSGDRLGSGKCEAVLAIAHRAPNNTLPIFWFSGRNKKRKTIFYRA